jgi:hypothetical protein
VVEASKSRDILYFAATAAAVAVLWYVWQKNQPAPIPSLLSTAQTPAEQIGAFPIPWSAPMDGVYNANPTAYDPPTAADLTVNVGNPYASMLNSAFMPLFGFVGMAQGVEL